MPDVIDPFGWTGAELAERVRIDAVIGEGGFSVVYRGFHLGLGDTVAVKCLKLPPTMRAAEREQFEAAFLEEGRLLHRLSRGTAGIVQALDAGVASSPSGAWTPYLILEWLEGAPLEDDLAERAARGAGGRSLTEVMALMDPAARALDVAHREGVAHRDIKPANLFLADVGGRRSMKVLDFGIAKVMTETAGLARAYAETGGSVRAFSAGYGAPEQFDVSFGATGPWTDVFAFALVLVELLTGEPALRGADTIQLLVQSSDRNRRPTPRARGVAVTDAVEAVFLRALAVDSRDRFPRLGELWDALCHAVAEGAEVPTDTSRGGPDLDRANHDRAARHDRANHDRAARHEVRNTTTTIPAVIGPPPRAEVVASPGRRSALWIAVPAALAVAGLGLVVLTQSGSDGETTRSTGRVSVVPASPGERGAPGEAGAGAPAMVAVAPATFTMGADADVNALPRRSATVARGFAIDTTEVTVDAYARCVAAGRCTPAAPTLPPAASAADRDALAARCNTGRPDRGAHPVNCVSHAQATSYCTFVGGRLPTEVEWELAARGTDGRRYPWGNTRPTCAIAVFASCVPGDGGAGTRPVGSVPVGRAPSGALDMAGNVWEWVADDAMDAAPLGGPRAPDDGHGILRGGSWEFAPTHLTTSVRSRYPRDHGDASTGFRCARDR